MDSPVQIPFKSFIQLDHRLPTAIYLQIVFEFIKAIQTGLLPEGTKLPGTRILCKLLGINRNTLVKAFQDLEAQGFIEILPNRGVFILSDQKQQLKIRAAPEVSKKLNGKSIGFDFVRSSILDKPIEANSLICQFNDGMPDLRLIHTDVLARLYVYKLKRRRDAKAWEQVQLESHINFKNHFSNYLNLTRGLKISSSNLLTTGSHEISLYLAIKLLIRQGDQVVVASPSYYRSNMTLSDSGANIISIPVDDQGIRTDRLRLICQEHRIKILYLTSNYHYPTTTCLSAKRRIEVLQLAAEFDFVILEDDYEFDFHHDNNPVLPLAAFDENERVVYIGSFSKSLPSGFGYGFITGPVDFIQELEKHQNILEPGFDVIKEQVLTEWIQDGEVHRLSKKNRKLYKERRDHFIAILDLKFGKHIKFEIPARGLAIWLEWQERFSLIKLQQECAQRGLFLPHTILYQTKNLQAIRLGFGHMTLEEMDQALDLLMQSWQAVVELS